MSFIPADKFANANLFLHFSAFPTETVALTQSVTYTLTDVKYRSRKKT